MSEENRFEGYIKYNKNKQIRTIERYVYILSKIPEEVFDKLKSGKDVMILDEWFKKNDNVDGFSFIVNGNLTKYAIKSYLKYLGKYEILPYINNLNLKSKRKSKDVKHWDKNIIGELIAHSTKKISYKKNNDKDLKEYGDKWVLVDKPEYEGERDKLFIKYLYYTGSRCSEALNFKFKDIDEKKKLITITDGKGGYSREALITVELIKDIKDFIKKHNININKNVFEFKVSINKDSVRYNNFINNFGEIEGRKMYLTIRQLAKAEYMLLKVGKLVVRAKNVTPHQMRHSLAMLLKKKNVPLDKIQKVLGHSSITTTQVYAKTSIDDAKKDYDKIMDGM